ncbi:hypothetical protein [Candidatus Nitrosocosmicus franklandus]|uniref:Uncharacterized protein n=1 Tax=Candidatus Nitrosocosmicus franklandianus TaxID=1798806 RepID=A0A484IBJ6_9ARCH|nr:hypothetical protein [Candidatus Nitrosocosmicus franklandus]VFJ13405.1 conserved exported protein of unknown function [Candidatus Nitrosocosmicus franklandus]
MKRFHFMLVGVLIATSMLVTAPSLQMSYAHQRALFNINGQDYLFVVGSLNEPISVDDKTGVELRAMYPDPSNPIDSRANGTKPVTGLEESLKVEISAGDKNMTLNLEPAFGELGSYESEPFYPTIATTYNYRIFGDINGTAFDVTFSCNPAGGEAAQSDNSTVQISEGVERKALLGGFGCPEERIGFPEPYISQYEVSQALNRTSN